MAYIQELIRTQEQYIRQQEVYSTTEMGLQPGEAYSGYFPTWEVTSPQYLVPTAYTLANLGYRTNEVAYACIDLWMKTVSEPKIKVFDKKSEEFIDDHALYEFMEQPCPDLSETDFWNATVMYLKIAGFLGWEKDHSNDGSLIAIWPMLPQYCSFKRGERKLLRAIHYQPYTGLPGIDIPRERIVFFSYVDPLYFGLKPFSPTMVLKDIIGLDNNMTTMIDQFTKNGAFLGGLLKSEQIINKADAEFARERWQESHGGPSNAGKIAVVGKGLEFQTTNNTFRDMVFPEVDARSEVRICMAYGVKPILISAKVGMDRSTMNNYKEGKSSWYEENVTSEWQFLEERATRDLLREFDTDLNHVCKFDTSKIKALQEDRNAQWTRAIEAYKARVIIRNAALVEMGLDPIGDSDPEAGNEYYATALEQTSMSIQNDLDKPNTEEKPNKELDVVGTDRMKVTKEQEDEEEKHFRSFAKRRLKEDKPNDIGEFEFKYVSEKRQRQLLSEFGVADPDAALVLEGLREVVKALQPQPKERGEEMILNINNDNRETLAAMKAMVEHMEKLNEAIKQPTVVENVVNIPEQKAVETPIINVEVSPTPIQNNIEVKTPKIKKVTRDMKRDELLNLKGTVDKYEYEEDE